MGGEASWKNPVNINRIMKLEAINENIIYKTS